MITIDRYRGLELPDDFMERYAKRNDLDWAAKIIDPEAVNKYMTGDGFDRMQNLKRLLAARLIADTILGDK